MSLKEDAVMVSDAQLARALVSVARIFGESRSALMVEVESAPALDQAEVDAAIDRALFPDAAPEVAAGGSGAEFAAGPDLDRSRVIGVSGG